MDTNNVALKRLINNLAEQAQIEAGAVFKFTAEAEKEIEKFLEPFNITEISISPYRNNTWSVWGQGEKQVSGGFPWHSVDISIEELAQKRFEEIAERFSLPFEKKVFEVVLTDKGDSDKALKAKVNTKNGKIEISVDGYETSDCEGGEIVIVEMYEGRLRVYVYADVNEEEPEKIDLEGARAECYRS